MIQKVICFSSKVYDKEAILMTVSEYGKECTFHIDWKDDQFIVSYSANSEISITEFERKLIENSIRHDILSNTQDIRKLIMSRAFASTIVDLSDSSVSNIENEESEVLNDWFEKNP